MATMSDSPRTVGIAWYEEADFVRIKSLMRDGKNLPATYAEWLSKAKAAEETAHAAGQRVIRARIDPDTFADWCRANGHDVDSRGRMAFANFVAAKAHLG